MRVGWLLVSGLAGFGMTLALVVVWQLRVEAGAPMLALLAGLVLGCGLSWPGYYFLFRLAQRQTPTPPLQRPTMRSSADDVRDGTFFVIK